MTGFSVILTEFRKDGGPLTKRIHLNPDGTIGNDSAQCFMSRGSARRVALGGPAELADFIEKMEPGEAYALGRIKPGHPDRVHVVTDANVRRAKGKPDVIARTKEFLIFTAGAPGVALIDIDLKAMPDGVKSRISEAGEVWDALCGVCPALAAAACVRRASTSSGISNTATGETYPDSGGFHVAVLVNDGADIPRFLADLHDRLWLAGLGWGMVSAAGHFLERSLIDRSVGSPERLVFEGPPVVDPPLQQALRPAVAHEGDVLDAKSCPPLDEAERARVERLKDEEARRLDQARRSARANWSAVHIERMVTAGVEEQEARDTVDGWLDRQVLTGDFPLPFDDPKLAGTTVAKVCADPGRYAGKALADPIEGIAYGRGKARLFKNGASLVINSFAHGGCVYQLKAEPVGAGFEDTVALTFAKTQVDDFRFIAKAKEWRMWDGVRWKVDETLAAFDIARGLCREAGDADAKIVTAVMRLAASDRRLAATIHDWDADPLLAGTPGGTLDLRTGEVRRARREDLITKLMGVTPGPVGGPAPRRFLKFLGQIFEEDDELIGFAQRLFGYGLTGLVYEHVFAFLFGTGRNGKGTLLRIVMFLMGDYANTSPIEAFLKGKYDRHPTELARLHKVRLTVAQETPNGRAWDEAKIKNTTGGDPISARFMRGDFFDFTPSHLLAIAANHKPKLKVVDEAMRARLLLIPFSVTIPEAERETRLDEELIVAEGPAILRWFIDGCLEWQRHGLRIPAKVRAASSDYFHEQDAYAHWIDACAERRQLAWGQTKDLFASWSSWATQRGIEVGSEKAFSQALQERGWTPKRTKQGNGFKDLVLKAEPTDDREDGDDLALNR